MENDKRQAEECERHREEDRRRDDQRFQMKMMMMNLMSPNRQHHHSPFGHLNHTPTTVNSMEISREEKCEFDSQDIIEAELIRRTTGYNNPFHIFFILDRFRTHVVFQNKL